MLQLDEQGSPNIDIFVDTLSNLDGSIPYTYKYSKKGFRPSRHPLGLIKFQNNVYPQLNGCQPEDLLIVLIDRFNYLQCSEHKNDIYDSVLLYLNLSLKQLQKKLT